MMKKTSCAIIDADDKSRKHLKDILLKLELMREVHEFDHPHKALGSIMQLDLDVLFTDIVFGKMEGMEIIKMLDHHAPVVIVTRKENYSLKSYEYNVLDYILKPVTEQRILLSYNNYIRKFPQNIKKRSVVREDPSGRFFYVRGDHKILRIFTDKVLYVEGFNEYVRIHCTDKTHTVRSTMKEMEDYLRDQEFQRIHRSYIIPLRRIESISSGMVEIGKVSLPVSKSYKQALLGALRLS